MDDPSGSTGKHNSFWKKMSEIFRSDQAEEDSSLLENEIISMADEGRERGMLQESEVRMIHNIFGLNDTDAKDIMTHRKNMTAIDGRMTLAESLPLILEEGHSRFPVYLDDIDNLIGILHIRNILQTYLDESLREKPLCEIPDLLHSVFYIPETRSIDVLFREMQRDKNHIAVVVDEYGQTAGLVSMEDILEEIVGNIQDEYDKEEEMIVSCGEGRYIIQGFTPLSDIEEVLGVHIDDEDHETLNGFLISKLDRIPQKGEQAVVNSDGLKFQIMKVDNNAIQSVLVSAGEPSLGEENE